MEIQLEYPYNKDWRKGYLVKNSENRDTVILFNSSSDRSSTQYARYLMAVSLQRYLTDDETVDHIDGNKNNNDLKNLQILSKGDNIRKSSKKPDYICVCPICHKTFIVPRKKASGIVAKKKILSGTKCCSRQCGYKQVSKTLMGREP